MSFNDVVIRGGLGNQLFCLFHAYKILLNEENVSLNLASYHLSKRNDRNFILENLYPSLKREFKIRNGINAFFLFIYALFAEKILMSNSIERLPGDKTICVKYWTNHFLHSGYFQKVTNSELDIKALKLLQKNLYPYIKSKKNNCLAIHIRRGDYLKKRHSNHGLIKEKDIYKEARKLLSKKKYSGITIYSDSPDKINVDIFRNLHKKIILDEGGNDFEVFKRMCNHSGLIASNSSFSLWAGILGSIKDFSIPNFWMKNVKSNVIGFDYLHRYECKI